MSLIRRRMMMAVQEETADKMEWEIGGLSIWGGEETADTSKIRTKGFYPIKAGKYEITINSLRQFCFFLYRDKNAKPHSYGGYYLTITITCDTDCYLRLLVNSNDLSLGELITITKL